MRNDLLIARLAGAFVMAAVVGCTPSQPQALGTLEYDRITVPSPVAERIVAVEVREGERVAEGQPLLRLDRIRVAAVTDAARADEARGRAALAELEAGPRQEAIDRARATLAAAGAQARDANAYYRRVQPLGARQLVAAAEVDRARAAASQAGAQAAAARAALDELRHGTRAEQIAQGEAAARAASAQVVAQQATLDKLVVVAPRAARIDSLPYRLGDQAPVGAPLAILQVGDAPYARIYVPEPLRAGVAVGARVRVHVDGRAEALSGTVRMIRSEPTYTPYYALIGDDAARLSYLAEVALGADAADLPAGLPVRVSFEESSPRD